ncbi:MAG: PEP-CTERM sorting domain-containing protein [Proteobacteria bacterium]|nr:PEP-CTERM sorting domain-containing protein [Pseudomonadota bacterium]
MGAVLSLAGLGSPVACAANLVVNGDFAGGNVGFSSGYGLTTMTPYLFQNGVHGIYAVVPAGSIASSSAYGDWTNISADPTGGNGNVFLADGSDVAGTTFWSETVAVSSNTSYTFNFYGAEVSNLCCSNAVLQPVIGGIQGAALTASGAWQKSADFVWNSGSATSVTLELRDLNGSGLYNDFAVTDISLVPEPGMAAMMLTGLAVFGVSVRRASTRAS